MLNIHRKCKGDASETGLVQFAESIMSLNDTRAASPTWVYKNDAGKDTEVIIPFNSEFKFNLFVRDLGAEKGGLTVFMKGAPERILNRCEQILLDGKEIPFTDELRAEINEANSTFGRLGERVLAFARFTLDASKYTKTYQFDVKTWKAWGLNPKQSASDYASTPGAFPMHGLTLVGIVSLNDPPRLKVDLSVDKCRSAGIKVIMVTGDQPPTAAAIAHKVNIMKHPAKEFSQLLALGLSDDDAWAQSTGIVIHGDLLASKHKEQEDMEDSHKDKGNFLQDWISKYEVVFARTTPSQKLLIVNACQNLGEVVAVTGDGVNDSPAIKKADIGIAMGSGSDVAKNAADMLLLDDNFSSIVNGVEEGRLIFDNLKKSIAYTLSSNIPEISPFLSFITVGIPLPLSTVLILCIDLGTDMVPAISMAWEDKEADIMKRPPRDQKKDRLVTKKLVVFAYLQIGVIQAIAGFYSYMVVMGDYGYYSYTLPGLGADDAWQKVQLMCKVTNGVLRNEAGHAYTSLSTFKGTDYKNINNAFAQGYMFWDWNIVDRADSNKFMPAPHKEGVVQSCIHVPRTVNSENDPEPNKYKWNNPMTFLDNTVWTGNEATAGAKTYTAGRAVASVNNIIAMKKAGYIEYNPFAARMSAFYDSAWQFWEPTCKSTPSKCPKNANGKAAQYCCGAISGVGSVATITGFGESDASAHFAGIPIGHRIVMPGSKGVVGGSIWPGNTMTELLGAGKNDLWLGGKQPAPKGTSYPSDIYDIPTYEKSATLSAYETLVSDYTKAGAVPKTTGVNKCSSWSATDTTLTRNHKTDCATADWGLADNTYSWAEKAGEAITYRVNAVNRQLQREALAFAQTSGFTTIIVVQWADLMICKTRWLSIRQQGMKNPLMNFGLLFETILGAAVCFVPFLNIALQTRPLRFTHWFPGMPFMVVIFMYDEIRKYLMRSGGCGMPASYDQKDIISGQVTKIYNWVGQNTYY